MKLSKLILTFIIVIGFLSTAKLINAYQYPISELGNCRDRQECHLYCENPVHKAACWSFSVYGAGGTVLGDETPETKISPLGITFPISALGNCASLIECKAYCNEPQNVEVCQTYRKGNLEVTKQKILELAQTELGCTSSTSCHEFCTQDVNVDTCKAFFNKYNLKFIAKNRVFNNAKAELGCTDQASCKALCELPENHTKCQQFTQKNKLTNPRERLVEEAKAQLGCTSFADCREYCQNPDNKELCKNFGQGLKLRLENKLMEKLGCKTVDECKTICEANPDSCPSFPKGLKNASGPGEMKDRKLNSVRSGEKSSSIRPIFKSSTAPTETSEVSQ